MTNELQRVIDEAYSNKEDVYKAIAVHIFKLSSRNEVTAEQRRAAKSVYLMRIYGAGDRNDRS
jgi:DNA polymerase I-like protein with 3'-5' exonuclease and polymerase domains